MESTKSSRQNDAFNLNNYTQHDRISSNDRTFDMNTIIIWMSVSKHLWWFIIIIAAITFPILFYSLIRVYHWRASPSNYSRYLTAIIVADLLMFTGICLSLSIAYFNIKGALMCKWTMLLINMTACFVNWVWVLMFVQRFVLVFYPIRTITWRWLEEDNRRMLIVMLAMSFGTQVWTALLTTENTLDTQSLDASFCDLDYSLVRPHVYKWIAVVESMFTYAIPFLITAFADLAVLVFRSGSTLLVIVPESLQLTGYRNNNNDEVFIDDKRSKSFDQQRTTSNVPLVHRDCSSGIKIQSRTSMMLCSRRRKRAIHRCLIMTTVNLLLNLPNYILQLYDEFAQLRFSPTNSIFYIYADAIAYILYLAQFPLTALYVHCLSWDVVMVDKRRLRSHSQQSSINKSSTTYV